MSCVCAQNPAYFTGSDVRVRDPDLPKLHFAVAFKGAAWTDADAIPLMVIQSIIGAWSKGGAAGGPASAPLSLPVCLLCIGASQRTTSFEVHAHPSLKRMDS